MNIMTTKSGINMTFLKKRSLTHSPHVKLANLKLGFI